MHKFSQEKIILSKRAENHGYRVAIGGLINPSHKLIGDKKLLELNVGGNN